MFSANIERRRCPSEFQDRVTRVGGVNIYDEPLFKFIWGQTDTFRAGGQWAGNGQVTFKGYRDLLLGSGDPCWILMQWHDQSFYGKPPSYYLANLDLGTGLQTLGEYPYKGRYEIVLPLIWKGMINGRLCVEHLELSSMLVDLVVPVMKDAMHISAIKKRAFMLARKEADDLAITNQIEDRMRDATPAFGTASRSAARLECNSMIQKKAEQMERHWKRAVLELTKRGKGISIGKYT